MTVLDDAPADRPSMPVPGSGEHGSTAPQAAPSGRTAILILNPKAGLRAREGTVERLLAVAADLGWQIEVVETHARGDATRLAADAARAGLPMVLVAGGDGTLNEVVQGLAGTDT